MRSHCLSHNRGSNISLTTDHKMFVKASQAFKAARSIKSVSFLGRTDSTSLSSLVNWKGSSKTFMQTSCLSSSSQSFAETSGSVPQRVVIIGGGFGGLYAAIRLTSLFWPKGAQPQIIVIDKSERFTFKPLLYELLNNTATEDEVAPYFTQLLAPYPIRFIQSKVTEVEPDAALSSSPSAGGRVLLQDGASVEYDWLVLGLGSQTSTRSIPGVKELALPFNVYDDAVRVGAALQEIEDAAFMGGGASTIVIVGAGYAGVEMATVVAERVKGRARVQVVTPNADILDGCPEGQRLAAGRSLGALGVEVITGAKVTRLERSETSRLSTSCTAELSMDDGTTSSISADLVVWTAGSSPATREDGSSSLPGSGGRKGLPFPMSARGSIQTEPTLRVIGNERVFALGDVSGTEASFEDLGTSNQQAAALPATAQVAFQQADYVAWNLWASMNGRSLLPFKYQHLGSMMSLGSLNAAVALPVPVPLPIKSAVLGSPLAPLLDFAGVKLDGDEVTLEGPLAMAMRRAAYLYRQPTNEQRLSVASGWLQQALTTASGLARGGGTSGQ